jgi:beta-phosphoglucomutase-like phosphatase (HAD superfamily)
MTAEEFLAVRRHPLRLVVFDCDGVLVDSEGIANRIIARELTEIGWAMTPDEADRLFLGMTLPGMVPMIEAEIGRPIPHDFGDRLRIAFEEGLSREVEAIDGAIDALDGVTALGLPWRVASNSSHAEMEVKFARLGILDRVQGRQHSYQDVARGKPAPDVYYAAAAAEGVRPRECLVIEDSLTGVRAAIAAGMDCLAYAPHGNHAVFRALGAVPFNNMSDLPRLIALAPRSLP